jgi:hypothetical protein
MYMHPDMGRLLIRAKLDEAQSRMRRAPLLRAASLEQQQGPETVPALARKHTPEPPIPAAIDSPPERRARLRASAQAATERSHERRFARSSAARPGIARARAQDCHQPGRRDPAAS